jgi:NAD(P)-dependent dehydrogenase (short-subunit alcohol dehydrogenase family)
MSLSKESVVVITGAASGIGRALAVQLAKEAIAGIAIADVDAEALAETEKLIARPNLKITAHRVNVADEAEMRAFAAEVVEKHGRVTHVINNAGVALGGSVREVSLDDLRWLMNINFWGVVYGTKLFLPFLEKEKSAHVVNFSSIFGVIAPPGQAAYCASKFAVRGFTESLRHELAGSNITVSVVHPGGVKTNIANNARVGEGVALTQAELEERKKRFNANLERTTPEQAAETIVKGIKARSTRIVVGADARALSLFARLFPRRYFPIVNFLSGGRLKGD